MIGQEVSKSDFGKVLEMAYKKKKKKEEYCGIEILIIPSFNVNGIYFLFFGF